MYIYDETYYSDKYLKKLNDTERIVMFKGSFVAQMGMTYEEVVEYIRKGKLVISVKSIIDDDCICEIYCTWNGNSTTFKI